MAGPEAAPSGGEELASPRHCVESRRAAGRVLIVISAGSCALARGAAQVAEAIETEILKLDLAGCVEVRRVLRSADV